VGIIRRQLSHFLKAVKELAEKVASGLGLSL
jgi:hypothetical protein